ncbi:MAG TPA: tetratricopeptide repeat protein, partial [Planctomycetes bacterium]|nr:tetratricopeptide repeat protein [Planctomycetota bacterium]
MPLRTSRAPSRSFRASLAVSGLVLVLGACGDATGARPEGWLEDPPIPARMEELEASVAKRIGRGLDAIREDPDSAQAWGELGMLYEVVVLRSQAIECYEQAALRDPSDPRWPYREGVCRGRMDEVRAAIADLERSIEIDPSYAPAQYRRGTLALEDGDLALAREAFAEARRIDPEFMGGWVGEAHVLLLEDRPEEAVSLLEKQVERDPEDIQVLQLLNTAYRQSGSDRRVRVPEKDEGEESEGRYWSDPWQEELRRFRRTTRSNRMARLLDAGRAEDVIE